MYCEVFTYYNPARNFAAVCGNDDAHFYEWGCVHEHIGKCWVCDDCASKNFRHRCSECRRIDGHDCPTLLKRIEDEYVAVSPDKPNLADEL